MADGHENLIPMNQRTVEEQREITRKGGIASGEARRAKKTAAEFARLILEQQLKSTADLKTGDVPLADNSVIAAIMAVHANKAMEGDVQSAKLMIDTLERENSKQTMLGGFKFVIEPGDSEI